MEARPLVLAASIAIALGCTKFGNPVDSGTDESAVEVGAGGTGGTSPPADAVATGGAGGAAGAGGGAAGAGGGAAGAGGMVNGSDAGDGPSLLSNGSACTSGPQCASGNCTSATCCPTGQSGCGGACFDLTSDNLHCGACGTACPSGTQTCTASHCLLADGQPCTTNAACSSGICSPFYVDADGDGYGTSATASFCGVTPPSGYAARTGDCCDSNNAINPGADFHTTIGMCNGVTTWDYNCNGTTDYQYLPPYSLPDGCATPNVCPNQCPPQMRTETTLVVCGASAGGSGCATGGQCTAGGPCTTVGVQAFLQGCR